MGRAKLLIDQLIQKRANGKEFLIINTRMKLLMKGIDVNKISDQTPDDQKLIDKIMQVAQEFNISLN
jgi:hypothetical protein